jgi:DNA invertase Pin-like site-specific DNA recombinase
MFDEASLQRALERVESHESDGLIVARFSHLGTTLDDALVAIERIHAAGGRFASVADGIDLDTANGRLLLRLLLSVVDQDQDWSQP